MWFYDETHSWVVRLRCMLRVSKGSRIRDCKIKSEKLRVLKTPKPSFITDGQEVSFLLIYIIFEFARKTLNGTVLFLSGSVVIYLGSTLNPKRRPYCIKP